MGVVEVLDPVAPARAGGWKVDVSRGERNGRVSSEWFNRPDDERYLSLDDLWASVKGRSERSRSRVVQTADIRVEAARDNPERLHLMLPKAQEPVAPTHWAFGQLASIVGAPASYLRQLPAPLAGINLQYGLTNHRAEQVKTFETEDGRTELRAVTGPDYGRIHDHELVEAVQRIAGNGTGACALALFQSLRSADQDADDPEVAGFDLARQDAPEGSTLWIHDDEHGDVEAVIRFVLRLAAELDLTGLWGFQYALTCSRPRLDAFGGGAHVIDLGARKSIGWTSSQEWLAAALNGEYVDA